MVEHVPGKQNIIPDALSRNKHIPDNLVTNAVQLAAGSCRIMIMNEKHSCHDYLFPSF